jgi:hypothetical protein
MIGVVPQTPEQLAECLADPHWRIFSGLLYKIMIKGDGDEDGTVIPFVPNLAQRRFIDRIWHRNVTLKARQLGMTTLVAILWLDHALFTSNQRCGIIAQDLPAATVIFRDKVKFAYDNLPQVLRDAMPLVKNSESELLFAHNNSSIRVATSMRSGTIHRLLISEYGKICAKDQGKAREISTGSIPAVPANGILVIESTSEGAEGDFYDICQRAESLYNSKAPLTPKDYRFHFYAWWQEPKYRMPNSTVAISVKDHEYFDEVECVTGARIDIDQRAWYVATRDADFSGKEEKMWQEYPSSTVEAWQRSADGAYYAKDLTELRKRGGIMRVPILDLPVNTFWDIGNSDGCAIWFHQHSNGEDRFIAYYEAHNEDLQHYVTELRKTGYLFDTHFLPHDADHRRLGMVNRTTREMLEELMPRDVFVTVPVIGRIMDGIHQVRKHLKGAYFDAVECKEGIARLEGYRKSWNQKDARFRDDTPDKSNGCSEGADALRQWAQAKEIGILASNAGYIYEEAPPPDWRT